MAIKLADKPNETPIEELTRLVEGEQLHRSKECWDKIGQILAEHRCEIMPSVTIMGSEVISKVVIRALPLEK